MTAAAYDHTLEQRHTAPVTNPTDALAWLFDTCRLAWIDTDGRTAIVTGVQIVASDTDPEWHVSVTAYFEHVANVQTYTMHVSAH